MDWGMLMAVILDGALLGTAGFAIMSAVSMIRRKHRQGALFGMASMVSYMLFVWRWYTPFAQKKSFVYHYEITWFELAFRPGSYAFWQSMAFLGVGLILILANVLGIVRQGNRKLSVPTAAD